jgi:hypothetical protein
VTSKIFGCNRLAVFYGPSQALRAALNSILRTRPLFLFLPVPEHTIIYLSSKKIKLKKQSNYSWEIA